MYSILCQFCTITVLCACSEGNLFSTNVIKCPQIFNMLDQMKSLTHNFPKNCVRRMSIHLRVRCVYLDECALVYV